MDVRIARTALWPDAGHIGFEPRQFSAKPVAVSFTIAITDMVQSEFYLARESRLVLPRLLHPQKDGLPAPSERAFFCRP